MRHSIPTLPVILSFMKFCVARTFWVERHLDVVLQVLQVVGLKFLFYKTCRDLPWLRWLLHKWGRYLTSWTLNKKKKKIRLKVHFSGTYCRRHGGQQSHPHHWGHRGVCGHLVRTVRQVHNYAGRPLDSHTLTIKDTGESVVIWSVQSDR